jgi:polysaccharide export outer membrane protein
MIRNFLILIAGILIFSCSTPKDVVYFQDVGEYMTDRNIDTFNVYIHKNDLLAIMVNSKATEAALPFNLPMVNYYVGGDSYGQQRVLGYLVDSEGNIEFPVIGKLNVEGLTRNELRDLIRGKLIAGGYLNDPIITINFINFRVSVLGEVNNPGSFNVSGERTTILEALSMAGDLTIYGKRSRVAVIREIKGRRTILYHDLTNTDIFKSPFYFLQQNDIVYVEPNKRKIQLSNINQNNSASVWLSVGTIIMTATSIIISAIALNKK